MGLDLLHLAACGGNEVKLARVQVHVRIIAAIGDEEDAPAVGRPARFRLILVAVGELGCFAARGIDDPDMPALDRQVARPVELVVGAGDVAKGNAQLLLLLIFLPLQRIGVFLAKLTDEPCAVGRPFVAAEAAFQVSQRSRFAAVQRDEMQLHLFFVAAIGEEGDGLAVGRPARLAIGPLAVGERPQAAVIDPGQPEVGVLLLGFPLHALDREHDVVAVGRDLRVGRQLNPV